MHTLSPPPQVLVVDDDEGLSILVAECLQEAGLQATAIHSGARALELLKGHRPDLMLLDLKLRDLSGPALLERLKKEGISIPFIIVTGQGNERVAVEMMKQGALDYLVKDGGMLDRLPVSLDSGGLVDGLAEMIRRMNQGPVLCDFFCASPVEIKDNTVANHLFRIAQEAVNNAMKHSKARNVIVSLSQDEASVLLQVEDDGNGLSVSKKSAPGLGLQIMRHRANVIGATLETQSSPGKGVKIICTLRKRT